MAYSIPKTWAYKETLSSSDLNTYVRDNILNHESRLILEHDETGSHTTAVMERLNPIGTIRSFNVATNPATLLGFGTWAAHGAGRVDVCINASDTEFDTLGETGGEKTHLLTGAESGEKGHNHAFTNGSTSTGSVIINALPGGDIAQFNSTGDQLAAGSIQPAAAENASLAHNSSERDANDFWNNMKIRGLQSDRLRNVR